LLRSVLIYACESPLALDKTVSQDILGKIFSRGLTFVSS
jgi:hypothetical protein